MEALLDGTKWVGIGKNYVNTHYQDSIEKERMEWMQKLNYVFTFTYDNKKHTKRSFCKKLRRTLKRLGWQYRGVWKRSKGNNHQSATCGIGENICQPHI